MHLFLTGSKAPDKFVRMKIVTKNNTYLGLLDPTDQNSA